MGLRIATLFLGICCVAVAHVTLAAERLSVAQCPACGDLVEHSMVRWLSAQQPSGFYPYGFNFRAGKPMDANGMSGPQLARQALVGAALAEYLLLTHDERVQPLLSRLLTAMEMKSIPIGKSALQEWVESTGLLSIPVGRYKIRSALRSLGLLYQESGQGRLLSSDGSYKRAYSGSVALALIAELRYAHASGDSKFSNTRLQWLEGLLALYVPGYGFKIAPTVIDSTPYFDGEAWLALAVYAQLFPGNATVTEALRSVDSTFLAKYGNGEDADFFHWGAMAVSVRLVDTDDKRFRDALQAMVSAFLMREQQSSTELSLSCATMEGISDAIAVLSTQDDVTGSVIEQGSNWINLRLDGLSRLQIRSGMDSIELDDGEVLAAPALQDYVGAFLFAPGVPKTRVDMSAHCLSAILKASKIPIKKDTP